MRVEIVFNRSGLGKSAVNKQSMPLTRGQSSLVEVAPSKYKGRDEV